MSENKEGSFDMGSVSEEDPAAVAAVATAASTKPAKKAKGAKAEGQAVSDKEPAAPKEPKVPTVGEYGKRGLPTWSASLVEGVAFEGDAAKHHQRVVIYDLLVANGGTMTAGDLITTIENDEALLRKMNTSQPIMRCVAYQVNELVKRGVATTTKPERGAKAEAAPAAAEGQAAEGAVEAAPAAAEEAAA